MELEKLLGATEVPAEFAGAEIGFGSNFSGI
jgi:hypothetical protein